METTPHTKNISSISPVIARAIPFGVYIAFMVLESALSKSAPNLDLRWFYAAKVASVAVALGLLWNRYGELSAKRGTSIPAWVASIAVGSLIFFVWIWLDQPWAMLGAPGGWNPARADGSINWGLVVVRIAGAAAVVPIMEELFWRSLVLRWVRDTNFLQVAPAQAGVVALLVSSGLFALEHHQWLAGLVAGLAYAGTYMRTGNLWCAVVAHAVTNFVLGVWVVHTGQWQFW